MLRKLLKNLTLAIAASLLAIGAHAQPGTPGRHAAELEKASALKTLNKHQDGMLFEDELRPGFGRGRG